MYRHVKNLQFAAKPEKPDAVYAMKLQELIGGQFGELTVTMQYLFQGWNCRMPGKYKDMLLDIGTEEIGHVEMITTMIARLLEGAPSEATEKAAAANPVLGAVLGGMNPQQAIVAGGGAVPFNSQGVPWNTGYIVASGNLLADFRSNAHAEAQGRLQTSRLYNMTDDPGVRAMLKFNLARDTWHQQQWLLGIEQLQEDGFADIIEDSNFEEEDKVQDHTYWVFSEGSTGPEGRWARGMTLVDEQEILVQDPAVPSDDIGLLPPPDPKLYATYDGSMGKGKPGTAAGGTAQGIKNVVKKVTGTE
ncbi:manganese catalase family protein [Cryptosporangium sp. NPDC048952]|uniref:manganese catalase family protein n=1 Tax=Cryptosporangium sp. NPDC048952 TaxID=3363961 RepID=UPI00371ECFBA